MDLKVVVTAFAAVFLAELADKTQLVGFGLASKSLKPASVFLGSVLGYMAVTAITVLVGTAVGKHIKPEFLRFGGALLFLAIGVLMLLNKI